MLWLLISLSLQFFTLKIFKLDFWGETFECAKILLELCKNAYSVYMRNSNVQKHILLKLLTSNFLWDGSNLTITIKHTIKPMLNSVFFQNGGVKLQCSNFLHCIKTLVNTAKDAKFQLLMENLSVLYYNQPAA